MRIKDITKFDLAQFKITKGSYSCKKMGYDLSINRGTKGHININFYATIFKKYGYVTFYAVDNLLLMELSKDMTEDSYTITSKKHSTVTKLAGASADKISKFIGKYSNITFYNSTKSNPIVYVDLDSRL